MVDEDDEARRDLQSDVYDHFDDFWHDSSSWELGGKQTFAEGLDELSDDTLDYMLHVSNEQIEEFSEYGFGENQEEPPDWLHDMGWYDDDGEWHNPFWYH